MKKKAIILVAAMLVTSMSVFAKVKENKTVEKARETVENAAPDDWYAYAKSAEMCIRKNVNLKEAAEWLDKSLSIKDDAYNHEVKGDYYVKTNLPEKAIQHYVKSISLAKASDQTADVSDLQEKIAQLK